MGLTVLGLGAADHAVASYDASSWLWSTAKSEIARVNGVTARVDTRVEVAQGAPATRCRSPRPTGSLLLRDLHTGQVSSLDLTTLQVTATTPTTAGLGVSVALHEDAAFVIDAVQGVVRQLDPRTLTPVGEPVRYPPGITGGAFDGAGPAVDRGAERGHRLGDHRRAAAADGPASAAPAAAGPARSLVRTVVGRRRPATTWRSPPWTTASRCSTAPPAR